MSGHSKWSSIKHRKGAADAKRGVLFTKLARAIQVAPLGEARYRAIVDAFAGYAVSEINLLAFK